MQLWYKNGGETDYKRRTGEEAAAGYRGGGMRPGAVFIAFLVFAALAFLAPVRGAEAYDPNNITTWAELSSALTGVSAGSVLTLTDSITFSGTANALNITAPNLTLQGAAAGGAPGMADSIAALSGSLSPRTLESLAAQAGTLSSGFLATADAAAGTMSGIRSDGTRRTAPGASDEFRNARRWLSVLLSNDSDKSSVNNGLSLKNLRFSDVDVLYDLGVDLPRRGIVNGLIGNVNNATYDTSLGDITGNAFTNLTVTLEGTHDTQYLAGGGLIGVRSTGESPAPASASASATIGAVSGNFFRGVTVTTTDKDGLLDSTSDSAYIEGGGLIGVDAASSPANKTGVAEIGSLTDNLFTDITIRTDDILIGGGLIGLNNNSKHPGANIFDANTYTRLTSASGNVFAGDIDVTVGYSLRGGGVIGLNGLSTAGAELTNLDNNIFSGINVETKYSYIKGGGIVGLQTNYVDGSESNKFGDSGDPTDVDFGGITDSFLDSPWTHLDHASGNLFLDSNVTAATYLYGGGIVGLHSSQATANLTTLEKNLFKGLTVTTTGTDGANGYGLKGGGIVGVASNRAGLIGTVNGNYFDDIDVTVSGKLAGGGVIGIQSDSTSLTGLATGGDITNNSFTDIKIDAGAIEGGGVVGAHGTYSLSGFGGSAAVYGDGLSGNRLRGVSVTGDRYISGGGVFGVYSDTGSATMYDVNHNLFDGATVTTNGYIEGGGLIGVRSNGVGVIENLERNYFFNSDVTAGTYIDGGGLIGATSGTPSSSPGDKSPSLLGVGNIVESLFQGNRVEAQNGPISGGLIYSYGTKPEGMTITNSYFGYNEFYSPSKVYGTVTVDTGLANTSGAPYTLTLEATSGYYTLFNENWITENGATRPNALYFGTLDGMTTDQNGNVTSVPDAADADAKLVIRAEKGSAVMLFDPIEVNQDNGYTFDMEVRPGDDGTSGYFQWWGGQYDDDTVNDVNTFKVDRPGRIDLMNGSHTQIFWLRVDAPDHTLTLEQGGELAVLGSRNSLGMKGNTMTLKQANLHGDMLFGLSGTILNDSDTALLKINPPENWDGSSYVDIDGSTVRLTPFAPDLAPQPGDRFYLIATKTPDSITGKPTNGWATSYARGGLTDGYNFIIDTSVPVGGEETETNQYLVARLPDIPDEPDEPVTPTPPAPGPDNPAPVPVPTPVPEPTPDPYTPEEPVDPVEPVKPVDPVDPPWTPDTPGPLPAPTPLVPSSDPVDPDPPVIDDDPAPSRFPAPETMALTGGRLAGLAFIGARGTWLADHSYESANIVLSNDILSDDEPGRNSAVFAGIDGAWLRVDDDHSHVDIDGSNVMVGFATKERKKGDEDHPDSSFLWAAFADFGNANYDTYNNFDYVTTGVINDIHGSGSLRSYGVGLMARKEWSNGFRLEGSFRGGKLKNEFTAGDYLDSNGIPASYRVNAPYFGAHLGVGRTVELNDPRDRVDFMFRYYWNRQNGESVILSSGEWLEFLHDDSHRARLGARFSRRKDNHAWYIGAALEHEFSGSVHARTRDFTLPSSSLKGTTGIGEIGLIVYPTEDRDFSLETGIQGYLGKYEGFSAGVRLEWEF